jgi:ribonucleotide reductase alpha subunit
MIQQNPQNNNLFTQEGTQRFKDSYLLPHETDPQQRYAYVAEKFGSNPEHAQRLYDYASNHWLSFSTPMLAYGKKDALPVSCYLVHLADTTQALLDTYTEVSTLSMLGGGIGLGIGIRQADGKSTGVLPHLKTYDAGSLAYRQGTTRRGSYATYLDISHPDIIQFIEMRKPTGDPNMRTPNLHHGINITDDFMNIITNCVQNPTANDDWELKDHNGHTVETVSARRLWQLILETRLSTGEPYLHFIDTSRRAQPEHHKLAGLQIRQSNLCVSPETKILTSKGHIPIGSLKDQTVEVWNGEQWSQVTVHQTGIDVPLMTIGTQTNGVYTSSIWCTPEHIFYNAEGEQVAAADLKAGDMLLEWVSPHGELMRTQVLVVYHTKITSDTYCFTEPHRGMGVFNGILTGQCSEIILPTDETRTAICCLSSLNVAYWDQWQHNPMFIPDIAEMLDNALQTFINTAPKSLHKAINSATNERSIGLGQLGFHDLLQQKMIPFESAPAIALNKKIAKHIYTQMSEANENLANLRGPCPDAQKYGVNKRFSHMIAIAPNASTSILLGNTSPSIEPYRANAYRQDTLSGAGFNYNKNLKRLLESLGQDTPETWSSIMSNDGSVQHLSFLTDNQKAVFKTAMEIDQQWVVQHASDRQVFVDQAQSVNLFFKPTVSISYVHAVHMQAWRYGLKTLYYCRSEKVTKAAKIGESVVLLEPVVSLSGDVDCLACEG